MSAEPAPGPPAYRFHVTAIKQFSEFGPMMQADIFCKLIDACNDHEMNARCRWYIRHMKPEVKSTLIQAGNLIKSWKSAPELSFYHQPPY